MSLRESVKEAKQLSFKESVKKAKQLRLSWKGGLAILLGTILIGLLFVHFGKFELAGPTLFSALVIGVAIGTEWELRRHVWFWTTMTVIVSLHVLLISFVPWTSKWVPAIVIAPILVVDLYAMLWILSVVEKFVERPKTSER
jgi:hypothetical protein